MNLRKEAYFPEFKVIDSAKREIKILGNTVSTIWVSDQLVCTR